MFSIKGKEVVDVVPEVARLTDTAMEPASLTGRDVGDPVKVPGARVVLVATGDLPGHSPFSWGLFTLV